MTCEDCNCIKEGDWVESKLNVNVFGIVIGASGLHVSVQLSPTLEIATFHIDTLRRIDGDDEYDPGAREDLPEDNVIPVDFTKRQKLTAKTKTKGSA